MLNVIASLTLLIVGLWGIPSSFKWLDRRAAVRSARRAELEQLRFERGRAVRKAAQS
jgi:hypothetical protein